MPVFNRPLRVLRGHPTKRPSDRARYWSLVRVSGYCTSEGRFFYGLVGIVGSTNEYEFKVWPSELCGDGKLWFQHRFTHVITLRPPP